MRRKIIVGLMVLGVLVLTAGLVLGWVLFRDMRHREAGDAAVATTTSSSEEQVLSGRGTLARVWSRRQNLECAIYGASGSAAAITEGSVFLTADALRGDFILSQDGTTTVSSMIVVNGELYTWAEVEGKQYGVKTALASATSTASGTLDARAPLILETDEVRYDCKPWLRVDNSVFAPPSTILFKDLQSIQAEGMEYGTVFEAPTSKANTTTAQSCVACAAIKDLEAKAACRQALECRE